MKKLFVLIMIIILTVVYFPAILNSVVIKNLKTISLEELKPLYEKYIGFDVNEYAINDIISSIKATGYFSNVTWTEDINDNQFNLIIEVEENPPVSQVSLEINGVELIPKETLEASITLKKDKAFSFVQFKQSIENITKLYKDENYVVSNVFSENKDQSFVYVTGKIEGSSVKFSVIEYALYDIEFVGNIEGIEDVIERIKKEVNLNLYKNYLKKNPLFKLFDSEKNYYPKISDIQSLFQSLANYVYFSQLSNIQYEKVNTEKPSKVLKVFVVQNLITRKPVYIKSIKVRGATLYKFDNLATTPATFTNVDLLRILQTIEDKYDKDEYFINIQPELIENDYVITVVEYKFRKLNISGNTKTKTYTFDDLIKISSGDYASRKALKETYVEIYKTQFFDSIDFDIKPSGEDTLDVNLILKEKEKKFNFIGGGTWGPPGDGKEWYEGFAAQMQLSAINPFGYGQTFKSTLSLGFSGKNLSFDYSIRKPFGYPFSISTNLSYSSRPNEESITNDSTVTIIATDLTEFNFDFSLSTLKLNNIKYSFGGGLNYKFLETSIATNVNSVEVSSSTSTVEYIGGNLLLGINYENLDDLIIPTEGLYFSVLIQKYFGISGDAPVALKTQEELSFHFPIQNTRFSLASRIYASQVFQKSGADLTNYLNGLNSLRGAELSGDMTLLLNNEIRYVNRDERFPFYLASFVDFGYVGSSYDFSIPFKWSVGVELGLNVPMFGLIRIGEAYYNDNWNFFFLMGKTF
ncbi:BamA/OMP85 family outer membrane protein [Thermosipho atlanticus]|uniref:Outer membrane protein insertion porin family n=1 Tax=Thermosipho atlanticus DSM 15807 TaxID=1123380 RepID=A0A1M5TJV9_9BACT|nr:BamA/TamA family outer membrane protein [Thermosipho atlanticus]SHH50994.1 outer membrane protein insertion porin family [Thermosipho atlanticus DSM 15807]